MSILVIEDEQELAEIIGYALKRAGFEVQTAHDGMAALKLWRRTSPSLVLLDLNIPRIDGWEVCRQIRSNSATPIIILSGRKTDEEVVRGLNIGADDYITKPFSPTQLVARIEAVLRRTADAQGAGRARSFKVGDVELDLQRHTARLGESEVRLTNVEFRLLQELSLREGTVMRHHDLIQRVWGYHGLTDGRILKSHVRNLRRKIEPDPSNPRYLHTVPNVGYRFTGIPSEVA